jgi:hypothetical protein
MRHERVTCSGPWRVQFALLALIVVVSTWLTSCAKHVQEAEVVGTVTVAGKPLTRGLVNLIPDNGGPPVGGAVSSDGSFRFKVPLGSYRGTVVAEPQLPSGWKEGEPLPPLKLDVPEKYSSPITSGIVATIQSTEPYRLELKLDAM